MLFCLLIPNLRSLLPRDIYTKQSQWFRSSARYFEWKERLSLPAGWRGRVILRAKVQSGLNFCLVLSFTGSSPNFGASQWSWEVSQRQEEDTAGGSTAHPRGLHQRRRQDRAGLPLSPLVAPVAWARNYIEELCVCPPCLGLRLKMEEGREARKLDGLMGKRKVKILPAENTYPDFQNPPRSCWEEGYTDFPTKSQPNR